MSNLEKRTAVVHITTIYITLDGLQGHQVLKCQKPYLHHHLLLLPIHTPSCHITAQNCWIYQAEFLTKPCNPSGSHQPFTPEAREEKFFSAVPDFFPPALLKAEFALSFLSNITHPQSLWREPRANWCSEPSLAWFWILEGEFYPGQLSKCESTPSMPAEQ